MVAVVVRGGGEGKKLQLLSLSELEFRVETKL